MVFLLELFRQKVKEITIRNSIAKQNRLSDDQGLDEL